MGILQEKVYKTCITDLDELKQQLRTERIMLLRQPFVSGVIDSCISVMHVLYTSLAIFPTCCYQLDSNLANLEATDGINSRVSLSDSAVVARAR